MAFTDEDKQKMDNAAADAQNDLVERSVNDDGLRSVANWWREWVPRAGHKRLGRILLEYADKPNNNWKETA